MQPYRIVRATEADLGTIEDIARRTWPSTFGDILSPAQIDYMLDRMYRADALREQLSAGHVFHLLLAPTERSGPDYAGTPAARYRAVGYVSHQLDYLLGTTKIHKIYLLPTAQGRGFGRALLERVGHIARRAGQSRLRLDVNYKNRAVAFYERLGFVKLDRFDTDIGNGYRMEDWRMEREL